MKELKVKIKIQGNGIKIFFDKLSIILKYLIGRVILLLLV